MAAVQLIQDCIEKYPNYTDAYLMKAQNFMDKHKYKSALEVFEKCPLSPRVHTGMADCLMQLKRYPEAAVVYGKSIPKTRG